MDLVLISTQAWGVIWESAPSRALAVPVAGLDAILSHYTIVAGEIVVGAAATIYADPDGVDELTDPFETDAYGGFPGYVEPGRYVIAVAAGDPLTVEAALGGAAGGGGGSPITTWAPTNANLWNAGFYGWFLPGDETDLVFVAQDNQVTVSGVVTWSGADAGYAPSRRNILRSGAMPAEFRPVGSHSHITASEDPDRLWIFKLFTDGFMGLGAIHAADPGDVFGGVGVGGVDFFTSFAFAFEDWTYPLTRDAT